MSGGGQGLEGTTGGRCKPCEGVPGTYMGPFSCACVYKGFNASLRMKDKNIMDIDLRSGEGSGADCFHGVQNGVRWYALPPAVFPKSLGAAVEDQVPAILQQPSVMLDFLFLLFCSVLFCSVLFCSVLFCCIVLYCTLLYCTVQYFIVLCFTAL